MGFADTNVAVLIRLVLDKFIGLALDLLTLAVGEGLPVEVLIRLVLDRFIGLALLAVEEGLPVEDDWTDLVDVWPAAAAPPVRELLIAAA